MMEKDIKLVTTPTSSSGNLTPDPKLMRRSRKRPGNSFYEAVLAEAKTLEFADAYSVEGLDGEIAILRLRIRALLKDDPDNTDLILKSTGMVAKLVRTRYNITPAEKKGLKDAFYNVMKDIAVPLGIAALKK
jgi:hypothetical protein